MVDSTSDAGERDIGQEIDCRRRHSFLQRDRLEPGGVGLDLLDRDERESLMVDHREGNLGLHVEWSQERDF